MLISGNMVFLLSTGLCIVLKELYNLLNILFVVPWYFLFIKVRVILEGDSISSSTADYSKKGFIILFIHVSHW